MSQLANSILVPIFVTLIAQSSDQFIDISKIGLVKVDKPWLKTGGLVDDVFFIAAINIFIPLSLFLDPWEIYLRLKRWWYTLPYNRI